MNKGIRGLLVLFILVNFSVSVFAVNPLIQVKVLTDKDIYYAGDKVEVYVQIGPTVGGANPSIDAAFITISSSNKLLKFVAPNPLTKITSIKDASGNVINAQSDEIFPLDKYSVTGDGSSFYLSGFDKNKLILLNSLKYFGGYAGTFVLQPTDGVSVDTILSVDITPSSVEGVASSTVYDIQAVPKTITLKINKCGNSVCDSDETKDSCVADCGCKLNTDCGLGETCIINSLYNNNGMCTLGGLGSICGKNSDCAAGTFCHAILYTCVSGDVGADCDKYAVGQTQCDVGNYCNGNKCTAGVDGDFCDLDSNCDSGHCNAADNKCYAGVLNDPCVDAADCNSGKCTAGKCEGSVDSDGDGIDDSKENPLCKLNTPNPLKQGVTVFSVGHLYAGCVKGDMNNDGIVSGKDYMDWIDQYILQALNPSKTQASLGDMNSDDLVNGKDYMDWINIYNLFASS